MKSIFDERSFQHQRGGLVGGTRAAEETLLACHTIFTFSMSLEQTVQGTTPYTVDISLAKQLLCLYSSISHSSLYNTPQISIFLLQYIPSRLLLEITLSLNQHGRHHESSSRVSSSPTFLSILGRLFIQVYDCESTVSTSFTPKTFPLLNSFQNTYKCKDGGTTILSDIRVNL